MILILARGAVQDAHHLAEAGSVGVHEAVVEDDGEGIFFAEHLGERQPDEDADLLFGPARQRFELLFDVARAEPHDAPVFVHPQAAPRQERLEVGTRALDHRRDEALLHLASRGVEGGDEPAGRGTAGFGRP